MTDTDNKAIREALQFIAAGEIPAECKKVLMEVLSTALRDAEQTPTSVVAAFLSSERWEQHEIEAVAAQLEGKIACNWQHADELAMRLAAALHRRPDDVRKKAFELGFSAGVDYRAALSLHAAQESVS